MKFFQSVANYFTELQSNICSALESIDGQAKFTKENWLKNSDELTQGGGSSRIIKDGKIFEKGGVNFSNVSGEIKANFAKQLTGEAKDQKFSATGISLVMHPLSPMVPTTHANLRFLKMENKSWFGGGMDLTPYYLFEEDAKHFHLTLKKVCEQFSKEYYPKFKIECDKYFYLPHRKEHRGIGGIFFDYIGRDENINYEEIFNFIKALGDSWIELYTPIVKRRMNLGYTEAQRNFQLQRRGRYVEFNLLYDRGTKFGLETGGRTESILMSLPNLVRWDYLSDEELEAKLQNQDDPEIKLLSALKTPQNWVDH